MPRRPSKTGAVRPDKEFFFNLPDPAEGALELMRLAGLLEAMPGAVLSTHRTRCRVTDEHYLLQPHGIVDHRAIFERRQRPSLCAACLSRAEDIILAPVLLFIPDDDGEHEIGAGKVGGIDHA